MTTRIEKQITTTLRRPYSRVLVPDEGGGFAASIPEFPGCFAEGDSADDAYAALERAAHDWLYAALERGLSVPEPRSEEEASGKLLLRLPKSLHRELQRGAERNSVSLNKWIVTGLSAFVAGTSAADRLAAEIRGLTKAVLEQRGVIAAALSSAQTFTGIAHDFAERRGGATSGESRLVLREPVQQH